MSRVPYTIEQLKKLGLVEKDGVYVPVKSLVAKKVDKLPSIINGAIKFGLPTSVIEAIEGKTIFTPNLTRGVYFGLPNGESIEILHEFNISPIPAPRMTQSDKWKTDPYHADPSKRQRKPVAQYFAFRDKLLLLCQENGYKLTNTLNILFIVPFPKSYSKKKCEQLNNQPHDQKPDLDNFCKCWMDSLSNNDCKVWNIKAIKLWGHTGQIIIF